MGEKQTSRLTPEQNDARQAARAEKREQAKDARLVSELAVQLFVHDKVPNEDMDIAVAVAYGFLARSKEYVK